MRELCTSTIDIATPPPYDQGAPHFNGPRVFGAAHQHRFSYTFPVRGKRPMTFFSKTELPDGLSISENGTLSGSADAGTYKLVIAAKNDCGESSIPFTLFIGERMRGRTPMLSWTSWNAYTHTVNQEKVLATAKAMVDKGLAARGYYSVNIDSCWQGNRSPETHALQPNWRFPDMKGLVDAIHAMGLKAGIYSTPMVIAWGSTREELFRGSTDYPLDPDSFSTFFGGCGQNHMEEQDAAQWAQWDFDYLKYDWPACDVSHTKRMREALDKTGKDFLFSLTTDCHLDDFNQLKLYAEMYRKNPDTTDVWERIVANIKSADLWLPHSQPGAWFDLDMLALGRMAIQRDLSGKTQDVPLENRLTCDEQITHFAFWAFLPSPVQLSCDLTQIDDFTLNLVSNEELLAINQDEDGHVATLLTDENGIRVYQRQLSENRTAFGFVNFNDDERPWRHDFQKPCALRDPIAMRELPTADSVEMLLPPHGMRIVVAQN